MIARTPEKAAIEVAAQLLSASPIGVEAFEKLADIVEDLIAVPSITSCWWMRNAMWAFGR
jgi:hypothetical protein